MADPLNQIERKEQAPVAPSSVPKPTGETPQSVSSARQDIAGALVESGAEGAGGFVESGEKVRETAAEGREVKGDAAAKTQQTKKDDGQAAAGTSATFIYDDQNLPMVPDMIRKIEAELRGEIRKLERDANRFKGSILRKPDLPKYSETIIELREKNVLLKRIAGMAAEALKKLFLQMFGPKKSVK